MTIYLMPASFQELRDLVTKIRADFVANMVKEGQFTTPRQRDHLPLPRALGRRAARHLHAGPARSRTNDRLSRRARPDHRDRRAGLSGAREGQRSAQQPNSRDSSIVAFERYAVDLSAFNQEGGDLIYKPRERATTQLLFPDEKEGYYQIQEGRFRAELHDRLAAWLYPFAMMMIGFAALGDAQTTRQGRGIAIAVAVTAVVALRIAGFAASTAAVRSPLGVLGIYGAPLAAILVAALLIVQSSIKHRIGDTIGSVLGRVALPRLPGLSKA